MLALGGYFGARVLIKVGVGFLERGFHRLLLLLACPFDFLLSHRVAAQDIAAAVFAQNVVNFLLEEFQLEHLVGQELLDLRLGQGGDEMKLRLLGGRLLVGANHAPVPHQGDALAAQLLFDLVDLLAESLEVAGVAPVNLDGDRLA